MPPAPDFTAQNRQLFAEVAATYDGVGFLKLAARTFAAGLSIAPGERVLDIATGTGEVAAALAKREGGRRGAEVVGVDLAPEMVAVARQKNSLPDVTFEVADASALPSQDSQFDGVVCAAGLFFMPDMHAALLEWQRVLKPGGWLAFSAFGRGLLGPLPGLWREQMAVRGIRTPAPPLGRIPTPEAAQKLLQDAGFADIRVTLSDLPYTLATPQDRWADILAGLEGVPLHALDAAEQGQIAQAHLAELAALSWPQTVSVPLLVAQGRR